ncbi:4Fe-4S binding protein [Alphaproteobacteria bacterium]|nr:4Fe-4S binding protein [Alphaproteobacteria bacterium]
MSLKAFVSNCWKSDSKAIEGGKDLALFQLEGKDKCIGCKLCEVVCPVQAIIIDTSVDENSMPCASRFDIDMTKCISCGLCEKACPVNAIGFVPRRVQAVDEKEKLYYTKETLIENGHFYEGKEK